MIGTSTRCASLIGLCLAVALTACAKARPPAPSDRCVFDRARVFDAESARSLQETCAAVNRSGAGQLVIESVASLDGKTIKEFALALFNKYRIGNAGADDGVLVLVVGGAGRRAVRLALGYGLEQGIPDIAAGALLDEHYLPELEAHGEGPATVALLRALVPILERVAKSEAVRSGQAAREARAAKVARDAEQAKDAGQP
jgi:uncharacterized protein